MYIIVNKTDNTEELIEGDYPYNYIQELILEKGKDIIIISTYSNTIKIPTIVEEYGVKEVDVKNFNLPIDIIKAVYNKYRINYGK